MKAYKKRIGFFWLGVFFAFQVSAMEKLEQDFRDYGDAVSEQVKELYRLNHTCQTLDFVLAKKNEFCRLDRMHMGIWDVMNALDGMIDSSDPDLFLGQSMHAFQTAERLRNDGQPRWLILVGLIHDLGKVLVFFCEQPQWAVVGDTFPVGCAFSDSIVFPSFFADNPDTKNSELQTQYGIYYPGCGLENVHMSWGHDEYLYHVVKNYLPKEASYIIRFHSFYAAHKDGAYDYLMNDFDRAMLPWLKLFSQYDLYSKSSQKVDVQAVMPFYRDLVAEYFPGMLSW